MRHCATSVLHCLPYPIHQYSTQYSVLWAVATYVSRRVCPTLQSSYSSVWALFLASRANSESLRINRRNKAVHPVTQIFINALTLWNALHLWKSRGATNWCHSETHFVRKLSIFLILNSILTGALRSEKAVGRCPPCYQKPFLWLQPFSNFCRVTFSRYFFLIVAFSLNHHLTILAKAHWNYRRRARLSHLVAYVDHELLLLTVASFACIGCHFHGFKISTDAILLFDA